MTYKKINSVLQIWKLEFENGRVVLDSVRIIDPSGNNIWTQGLYLKSCKLEQWTQIRCRKSVKRNIGTVKTKNNHQNKLRHIKNHFSNFISKLSKTRAI